MDKFVRTYAFDAPLQRAENILNHPGIDKILLRSNLTRGGFKILPDEIRISTTSVEIKVGKFSTENSILLDDLLKIRQMASGIKGFLSSLSMLDDIPAFEVNNNEMLENISQGKKIRVDNFLTKPIVLCNRKNYFATNNGKVISLGEIEGLFFKPKKVLL